MFSSIPNFWAALPLAIFSVLPYLILLNVKAVRAYGGLLGRLWDRYVLPRLDGLGRRLISFATWSGFVGGMASVAVTLVTNDLIAPEISLAFEPKEPIGFTLQLAFINAGLIEEINKCVIALFCCLLVSARRGNTRAGSDRILGADHDFLFSAPFVCAAVGVGFAFIENIPYIAMGLAASPLGSILGRMQAAGFHLLINLNFGLTLLLMRRGNRPTIFLRGLLVAVLQHGVYDFFALPPVPFARLLAIAFVIGLFAHVISRMYRLMPRTRYRSLRTDEDLLEDPFAFGAQNALNYKPESKMRAGKQGGHLHARPETQGVPSFSMATNKGGPELSDMMSDEERWQTMIDAIPQPAPGYRDYFLNAPHRLEFPPEEDTPFTVTELPLAPVIKETLALEEFRGMVPDELREAWEAEEAFWAQVLHRNQADRVWDSSAFAGRAMDADGPLRAHNIDLTNLVPLRVLEFEITSGEGTRFVYASIGLKALYGNEFWVSFSHPYLPARWLFLHMAAFVPEQAPWLREFVPHAVDSLFVGEPNDWFRAILPVPLFDPLRSVALERRRDDELPLELLLLSKPEILYIARAGVPEFFEILMENSESWHNRIKRPPLFA